MFLKYSTSQIPPKKSRGKGSQGKKPSESLHVEADVDVFEESDLNLTVTESSPASKKRRPTRSILQRYLIRNKKALKENKKASRRQTCTRGSSEGTGSILRVLDESTIIFATSSKGTEEDQGDDEDIDWINSDDDEEKKDDTDDDKNEEMSNAKVDDSGKGDAEISDIAKENVRKTKQVKVVAKKAELPLTSSNLSVSSNFAPIPTTTNHNPVSSKIQTPTINLEQGSEKSASEILKIKMEQVEKQKMPKYTIKSADKATLKEYDLKSALYQTMHENKSFNRNPGNHKLYHVLMEGLIEDENAIDKEVADTFKDHKRKHDDDDEDPLAGPNQGSKTGKSAPVKESVKEPIAKLVMDDEVNTAGICTSSIELEYNFQECFNALTDKLDWNNPEGYRYPFDMSKPLPLQGHPGHLTVAADYFFNNGLEYLKSFDPERTYTTLITKTKAARYEIMGIKDMVPTLWSPTKVGYDKDALKGIKHRGVIYEDQNKQKRLMRADEAITKFSRRDTQRKFGRDSSTSTSIFHFRYNDKMSRRKWMAIDRKRSQLMVELIDKKMRERKIIQNLEVGARELEMDYKLMMRTI
ncbi:hypothetical protein Tco_0583130 [Tanacetum coccineum]